MTIIACTDQNWAIGHQNRLLFRVPEDLARFKTLTMGHALLMGRRTFESLPGLLPGRAHVVLSRDINFAPPGVMVCRSLEDGVAAAQALSEVFIIGGGEVYKALLSQCNTVLVTQIDTAAPLVDTFFPNLDEHSSWTLVSTGAWQRSANDLRFRYCTYKNNRQSGRVVSGH